MGQNHFAALPVALYGTLLLFAGVAYYILTKALIAHHGKDSFLASAIGKDQKGVISVLVYLIGIPLSFWRPWVGFGCYVAVAIMWLLPDRRIERNIHGQENG